MEKAYYVEKYSDYVDGQNEKNRKARYYDRVKTIDGILENNKMCPEETLYSLKTLTEQFWQMYLLRSVQNIVSKQLQGVVIIIDYPTQFATWTSKRKKMVQSEGVKILVSMESKSF